jgi:site-specific recombinase XerD
MSRTAAAEHAFAVELFRDYLTLEGGHRPNTVDSYLRDLRRFVGWVALKGATTPGAVTRLQLREFVFALKDLGLSTATIRRQVSALRTYYGFLLAEGEVDFDPSDRLEMPRRGRKLPDTLGVEEVKRLLEAPGADQPLAWRDRALLELGYGAGLRVSELCGLTLPAVWSPSAAASSGRCRCICTRSGRLWIMVGAGTGCCSTGAVSRSPALGPGAS